ncbi:hypothetical protein [Pseudoalteromonas sp.]|uniref:hypothetical protein n=1 Tax=Pseudoalteromonas sp. TaxID=53249 RepID=UPI0026082DD5|nr:hypothetical protein [Pseudoalteromonas sp.]MCP4585298.1 hypothetical protein [Pseudoalteromonas sp.]
MKNLYGIVQEDISPELELKSLEYEIMKLCEEWNITHLKMNQKGNKELRELQKKIKKRSDING